MTWTRQRVRIVGCSRRQCGSGARPGRGTCPYGEAPLQVRWHKTQFACREKLCPRKAFTESIDELPPYARITGRTRRAAAAAVGAGQSVAAVSRDLPMSWPIAHAAFVSHADRCLSSRTRRGCSA